LILLAWFASKVKSVTPATSAASEPSPSVNVGPAKFAGNPVVTSAPEKPTRRRKSRKKTTVAGGSGATAAPSNDDDGGDDEPSKDSKSKARKRAVRALNY